VEKKQHAWMQLHADKSRKAPVGTRLGDAALHRMPGLQEGCCTATQPQDPCDDSLITYVSGNTQLQHKGAFDDTCRHQQAAYVSQKATQQKGDSTTTTQYIVPVLCKTERLVHSTVCSCSGLAMECNVWRRPWWHLRWYAHCTV